MSRWEKPDILNAMSVTLKIFEPDWKKIRFFCERMKDVRVLCPAETKKPSLKRRSESFEQPYELIIDVHGPPDCALRIAIGKRNIQTLEQPVIDVCVQRCRIQRTALFCADVQVLSEILRRCFLLCFFKSEDQKTGMIGVKLPPPNC